MIEIFPQQQNLWQSLWACAHAGRLPHALLFLGQEGIGKRHFAESFAKALVCDHQTGQPCGACHSCQLMRAGSHPDFLVIEPENPRQAIRVDAIREVTGFATQTALIAKYRVILIDPAPAMNINAANALLKILEEPPAQTVFMLVSRSGGTLPATVTSRCQKVLFPPPELEVSLESGMLALQTDFLGDWQRFTEGAVNLCEISAKWSTKPLQEKITIRLLLDWLFFWVRDLARKESTQGKGAGKWLDFHTRLLQSYAWVTAVPQLNRQLLLEDLMLSWMKPCN